MRGGVTKDIELSHSAIVFGDSTDDRSATYASRRKEKEEEGEMANVGENFYTSPANLEHNSANSTATG